MFIETYRITVCVYIVCSIYLEREWFFWFSSPKSARGKYTHVAT